jgi:hypothetical protein
VLSAFVSSDSVSMCTSVSCVVRWPLVSLISSLLSSTPLHSPPVSAGDKFQDLPRMPETADSSEPYIYKRRVNFSSTKVDAGKLKRIY